MPRNWKKTLINSLFVASIAANFILGARLMESAKNPFLIDLRNIRGFTLYSSPPLIGTSVVNPNTGRESTIAYYHLMPRGRIVRSNRTTYPSFPCRIVSLDEFGSYPLIDQTGESYPFGMENGCGSPYVNGAPH